MRQDKSRHAAGIGTAPSALSFEMVAASYPPDPHASMTLASELGLVKASLLYGDRVSIVSPRTAMLLRVEALERFAPLRLLELIRRVAPTLQSTGDPIAFELGLRRLETALRSRRDPAILRRLVRDFAPMQEELARTVRQLGQQIGIDQLARARASGSVDIDEIAPADEIDLLAEAVISARLVELGQKPSMPNAQRLAKGFVRSLSRHLSSGQGYLVFDQPTAELTDAAIRAGVFTPAAGPAGRATEAMTAASLLSRLPTFPNATVDEILDIRNDLSPALLRFRAAMVTVSKDFAGDAWASDFQDEVSAAWVETVLPALAAIEESVRSNHSLLTLAAGLTGTANSALPGLMILAGGVAGHATIAELIGGGLSVTAPVLQVLRDFTDARAQVRMQPFYFLYALKRPKHGDLPRRT